MQDGHHKPVKRQFAAACHLWMNLSIYIVIYVVKGTLYQQWKQLVNAAVSVLNGNTSASDLHNY